MKAPYTPPAGQALCPHCGAAVPVTVAAPEAEVVMLVNLRCPACGQRWHENRDAAGAERYWTPAAEVPS